jgi:hypothetical protein
VAHHPSLGFDPALEARRLAGGRGRTALDNYDNKAQSRAIIGQNIHPHSAALARTANEISFCGGPDR